MQAEGPEKTKDQEILNGPGEETSVLALFNSWTFKDSEL